MNMTTMRMYCPSLKENVEATITDGKQVASKGGSLRNIIYGEFEGRKCLPKTVKADVFAQHGFGAESFCADCKSAEGHGCGCGTKNAESFNAQMDGEKLMVGSRNFDDGSMMVGIGTEDIDVDDPDFMEMMIGKDGKIEQFSLPIGKDNYQRHYQVKPSHYGKMKTQNQTNERAGGDFVRTDGDGKYAHPMIPQGQFMAESLREEYERHWGEIDDDQAKGLIRCRGCDEPASYYDERNFCEACQGRKKEGLMDDEGNFTDDPSHPLYEYPKPKYAENSGKMNLTMKELLILILVNKDWNGNDWGGSGEYEDITASFYHDEVDMKKMRGVLSSLVKKGIITAQEDYVNEEKYTMVSVNNKYTQDLESIDWNMFDCKDELVQRMGYENFIEWANNISVTIIRGMMNSKFDAETFEAREDLICDYCEKIISPNEGSVNWPDSGLTVCDDCFDDAIKNAESSPSSFDISWEDAQGVSSPSLPPEGIHFAEEGNYRMNGEGCEYCAETKELNAEGFCSECTSHAESFSASSYEDAFFTETVSEMAAEGISRNGKLALSLTALGIGVAMALGSDTVSSLLDKITRK